MATTQLEADRVLDTLWEIARHSSQGVAGPPGSVHSMYRRGRGLVVVMNDDGGRATAYSLGVRSQWEVDPTEGAEGP